MPNIHAYLPDELYSKWKPTFDELGIDASKWIQAKFTELLNTKKDIKALQAYIIEKKNEFEKLKAEIDNTESLIKDLQLAEEKRREIEKKENILLSQLDPAWVINMAEGIVKTYQIDKTKARAYAVEYLTLKETNKNNLTVTDFIKDKIKEKDI